MNLSNVGKCADDVTQARARVRVLVWSMAPPIAAFDSSLVLSPFPSILGVNAIMQCKPSHQHASIKDWLKHDNMTTVPGRKQQQAYSIQQ